MSNYNTRTLRLQSRFDVNTRVAIQSSRHSDRGLDESPTDAADISSEDSFDIITQIKAEFSDSNVDLEIRPQDMYFSEEVAGEPGPDVEVTSPPKSSNDKHIHLRDPSLGSVTTSKPRQQTSPDTNSEETHTCEECEYSTDIHFNLKTHMRSHTGENRHITKHTGEKMYKCELCDYKTNRAGNLGRHMRSHTGEKPFKCELCDYKATRSCHLRTHMKSHTGEKPFKCEICDYKTYQPGHLHRHMRSHTGEKPFKCELCDHKTSHASNLLSHMRRHTGEKPFGCDICDYKTAQSSNLRIHRRKHI